MFLFGFLGVSVHISGVVYERSAAMPVRASDNNNLHY